MVAAYNAKAQDVAFVVEDLEALHAVGCGESGDDVDLPEGSDTAISEDDMATLDEMLVSLRIVEAPDNGPHFGDRGIDLLDDSGAALILSDRVCVVAHHRLWHLGGARSALNWLHLLGLLVARHGCTIIAVVDSVKQER